MIEEPRVVNITKYMPVEDVTAGGMPKLKNTGLNIAPPPSPRAPETHPPAKATATSFLTMLGEYLRSLLQIPLLYLTLKFCS